MHHSDTIIVFHSAYNPGLTKPVLSNGEEFSILKDLDFDSGNWFVLIDLTRYRNQVHDSILLKVIGFPNGGIYILEDINFIRGMKREWIVRFLDTDCCTPDFNMDFFQNNQLRFSLGIVLDKKLEGFQTNEYGWTPITKSNTIQKYYSLFTQTDAVVIKR